MKYYINTRAEIYQSETDEPASLADQEIVELTDVAKKWVASQLKPVSIDKMRDYCIRNGAAGFPANTGVSESE